MPPITDHPLRYPIANELHARPFPSLGVPGFAAFLAIKAETDAARRDRAADLAHLLALLDRFGAPHPQPGATHYFGALGRFHLKWESHTEFVTYTMLGEGPLGDPFADAAFDVFPADWLARAPGLRMTSLLLRVEPMSSPQEVAAALDRWFVPESLAAASVLDGAAVIAGDFRIDGGGHMRFAVFAGEGTGPHRIGRIVQRVCEIETYKTMSMLGLMRARAVSSRLGEIDGRLLELLDSMQRPAAEPEATLAGLLSVSADLENLAARSAFRFGATAAYEALVNQRIGILQEERFASRQTFGEFMMRRFDPAMRTVKAAERQMAQMVDRAARAGELLRTQVDVARSAQNQKLLESMNQRADMHLRLQRTVEGLSVVAISYYAVNLLGYVLHPFAEAMALSKAEASAAITLPVVLLVWMLVQRIRRSIGH